ncbi:putative T6SS immunity periplasmic lipoprotein [uncultured Cedecea sp.]|uniref:putative T6SS immunity periplasmic lipoprotein n=1 Tax=uncultured Cedecea sp. TaxID=988762 RepID=UPI002622642C|nr:putative T6SS immunity periplasmic lipoprotein [uncultured Cedecea sp.]
MVIKRYSSLSFRGLILSFIFLLTGCPGQGDRLQLDETTQVNLIGANVCFHIANAQDYQPAIISINPRGTPSKNQAFVDNPPLLIKSSQLCIPPSFYKFENNKKYIVDFVLVSVGKADEPRKFVVGVGLSQGQVYNFPLTDLEILRPYGSIEVSE